MLAFDDRYAARKTEIAPASSCRRLIEIDRCDGPEPGSQPSVLIAQKPTIEQFIRMLFRCSLLVACCLLLVASRRMSISQVIKLIHLVHLISHPHPRPRPHSNAIEGLMKPEISWDAVESWSYRATCVGFSFYVPI